VCSLRECGDENQRAADLKCRPSVLNLKENEFTIYSNEQIPVNDGGLALGQLYIAEKITEVDENVSCYTNAGC